jgi:hypothetical protein
MLRLTACNTPPIENIDPCVVSYSFILKGKHETQKINSLLLIFSSLSGTAQDNVIIVCYRVFVGIPPNLIQQFLYNRTGKMTKGLYFKYYFMKNLLACLLLFLMISCSEKAKEIPSMAGAYYMTRQVINDGTRDSVIDRKQLKIYTDRHMMFATPNLTDSFATFGIAEYKLDGNKLYEYIFYSAAEGDQNDTAELTIEKTDKGYIQVIDNILFDGRNVKLTEEYEMINRPQQSSLDGAWKQIKNVYINKKGDSSVNQTPLEYKIYQSGYFIWAITTRDSANQKTSVFGYGPFEMTSPNKSKETVQNSTFVTSLIGKTYEVDIEFIGTDSYKQTITFANGEKSIEIYQKLK